MKLRYSRWHTMLSGEEGVNGKVVAVRSLAYLLVGTSKFVKIVSS